MFHNHGGSSALQGQDRDWGTFQPLSKSPLILTWGRVSSETSLLF